MTKEEILKELDEQFLTNPKKKISLISGDEKRELSAFITKKIHQVLKEMRPDELPYTYYLPQNKIHQGGYEHALLFYDHKVKKFLRK